MSPIVLPQFSSHPVPGHASKERVPNELSDCKKIFVAGWQLIVAHVHVIKDELLIWKPSSSLWRVQSPFLWQGRWALGKRKWID